MRTITAEIFDIVDAPDYFDEVHGSQPAQYLHLDNGDTPVIFRGWIGQFGVGDTISATYSWRHDVDEFVLAAFEHIASGERAEKA